MSESTSHPRLSYAIFLAIIGLVFVALLVVFLCYPRSTYSELEKRDLAEFPRFSEFEGTPAEYTAAISQWFSDSEPYRDQFMAMSMAIRHIMGYNPGNPDEAISFKGAEGAGAANTEEGIEFVEEDLTAAGNPLADENAKLGNSGTIVVGSGDNARGLMVFGGTPESAVKFAKLANRYAEEFPNVRIYALAAPLATEFYLPEKGKSLSKPQKPVIDGMKAALAPNVSYVDAYSYLAAHTDQDIYLRTDHHWAPLGAFYAAKAFAKAAGVSFKELDSYDKHVIHRFVGSMFGYTKDMAIKNAPEDFVYYTPKGLNYKSTFITYYTDKNYQITSASKPYQKEFFQKFGDGSSNAYLTFMGSDQHLVKVETGSHSPRRLLIVKDSYGNALPGYLFYSFDEVHVVDFRYFPRNIKDYVRDNGITDILLAFNVFNACSSAATGKVERFLTNSNSISPVSTAPAATTNTPAPATPQASTPAPATNPAPAPSHSESSASAKQESKSSNTGAGNSSHEAEPAEKAPAPEPAPAPAPAPAESE